MRPVHQDEAYEVLADVWRSDQRLHPQRIGRPAGQAHRRVACVDRADRTVGPPHVQPQVAPWGGLAALGWRSLGMLELTALPTIPRKRWEEWLRAADALLVDGGDATYLAHHIRMSGLAELVPALDGVWVGISAGSMAVTPQIGDFFVNWPGAVDDGALGLVDFAIFPHLDVFPTNSLSAAHQWAEGLRCPSYVLDDASAVVIRDGLTDVVSEGVWYYLPDDEA